MSRPCCAVWVWQLCPASGLCQFLYPEGSINGPFFDPDESTYQWFLKADGYRAQLRDLQECVIHPGEALYFPPHWKHAILNKAEYNVFVSTFT